MFDLNVIPFVPHRLLRGAHAQTIAGAFLHHAEPDPRTEAKILRLPDCDCVVLHDDCPSDWCPGQRQAILIHGLGGCHRSGYMARTAQHLRRSGIRSWRMDQRGCGAGAALASNFYHAGRTGDLQWVVQQVAKLTDGSPICLIGFSLGGNLVLQWLAQSMVTLESVDSAIVLAPPIDLLRCTQNLSVGLNRGYDLNFTWMLRRNLLQRRRRLPDLIDVPVIPLPRRLIDFDDKITAPHAGFANASEYYRCCSSAPLLTQIKIPTLIVAAADDPVIPVEMFDEWPRSSSVDLLVTEHGGHLGYIASLAGQGENRWLDTRIRDWVVQLSNQ